MHVIDAYIPDTHVVGFFYDLCGFAEVEVFWIDDFDSVARLKLLPVHFVSNLCKVSWQRRAMLFFGLDFQRSDDAMLLCRELFHKLLLWFCRFCQWRCISLRHMVCIGCARRRRHQLRIL